MADDQPPPSLASPTPSPSVGETEPLPVAGSTPATRRLLWACAGANPQILALCPSEHQRYASLGAAVLISSTMAAISGTVALATASDHIGPTWTGLLVFAPLGLLYGAAIFGIDRFLVSNSLNPVPSHHLTPTNHHTADGARGRSRAGQLARTVATAVPRLLIAGLIGLLIAEPLLLWLFKAEIDQQIHHTTTDRLHAQLDELDTHYQAELDWITARENELTATDPELTTAIDTIAELDTEITDINNRLADLHVTLRSEISGLDIGGTSGQAGDGPVADEIRAEIDLAANRLDALVEQRQHANTTSTRSTPRPQPPTPPTNSRHWQRSGSLSVNSTPVTGPPQSISPLRPWNGSPATTPAPVPIER